MNELMVQSEERSSGDTYALKFGDWPFAVSVFCKQLRDGYTSDWIVSGIRKTDATPRFLLRLQMGINSDQAELRDTCFAIWDQQLQELAFHAAIQGGQDLPANSMPRAEKDERAEWHLFAHDKFGNFGDSQKTVTIRTANLFNLLKSLGYVQAQKMITDFEIKHSAESMTATTISRRLHMARQAGLIPLTTEKSDFIYPDTVQDS